MPADHDVVAVTVPLGLGPAVHRLRAAHRCTAVAIGPAATTFWVAPDAADALRAEADREAATTPDAVVYFDFNSPWSYVSTTTPIPGAAWRPFELLPPWRPTYDVTSGAARSRWAGAKAAIEAAGLPTAADRAPLRRTRAAHLAVLHVDAVDGPAVAHGLRTALFRAHWTGTADLEDANALKDLAYRAGADGNAVAEAVAAGAHLDTLTAVRTDAVAHGVFGVPTARIGPTVLWGRDLAPLLTHP